VMTIGGFSKDSSEGYKPVRGNPVPTNFKIVQLDAFGANTVAVLRYPDARYSYEGMKVLVFQGTTIPEIRKLKSIDPHFSAQAIAPFARFEPTTEGLHAARLLAQNIPPAKGNREGLRVCVECGQIKHVVSYSNRICGDCITRIK